MVRGIIWCGGPRRRPGAPPARRVPPTHIYFCSYSLGTDLQQSRLEANKVDDCDLILKIFKPYVFNFFQILVPGKI